MKAWKLQHVRPVQEMDKTAVLGDAEGQLDPGGPCAERAEQHGEKDASLVPIRTGRDNADRMWWKREMRAGFGPGLLLQRFARFGSEAIS